MRTSRRPRRDRSRPCPGDPASAPELEAPASADEAWTTAEGPAVPWLPEFCAAVEPSSGREPEAADVTRESGGGTGGSKFWSFAGAR